MSLFPAYSTTDLKKSNTSELWLENTSFINTTQNKQQMKTQRIFTESKKKRNIKYKKQRNKLKQQEHQQTAQQLQEIFYFDRNAEKRFLNIPTLHKPSSPIYKKHLSILGSLPKSRFTSIKRYYNYGKVHRIVCNDSVIKQLSEDFEKENAECRTKISKDPKNVNLWCDFVKHQESSPIKLTKTQLAKLKMSILDNALVENPSNHELLKIYVEIIDQVYPSFEVSKILQSLLVKDTSNFILWNAQILATQGSMAGCIVPNVLQLYEQCLKNVCAKRDNDKVMLTFFKNCCLFLRQSGLYEQFFALIKLALTVNISAEKFQSLSLSENEQHALIEYEEVVLKSGLPMKDIWLRIEKLRQNFYFLPSPENQVCSDPQRCIFNEDIIQFVYPLKNKEYRFHLSVIILELLKIPMLGYNYKQHLLLQQENCSNFDSVEEILPMFLYQPYTWHDSFNKIMSGMIKDYCIGPTYITALIGNEIYLKTTLKMLLACSESFENIQQRNTFILLFFKLKRVVLILEKLMGKMNNEKMNSIRVEMKSLLRKGMNRNVLMFYTEYALIEFALGNVETMETIFQTAIHLSKPGDNGFQISEYVSTYINYVEVMMALNKNEKALDILNCLANNTIGCNNEMATTIDTLNILDNQLNELVLIEENVSAMTLQQCFLPDHLVCLVKANIYCFMLLNKNTEGFDKLETLIKIFDQKTPRHEYIRENLYEIYANTLQFYEKNNNRSNHSIYHLISRGLEEFPNNLCLLRIAAVLEGQSWLKLQKLLTKSKSSISILFLIVSAKYRSYIITNSTKNANFSTISSDIDANEFTYNMRICNLLKNVTDKNSITRKNSLLWRIYLQQLQTINKNVNKSKAVLLAALDECPWNKALYLDGTVYVPQEAAHIQDLLIEKQLRIYALPEELEILRQNL